MHPSYFNPSGSRDFGSGSHVEGKQEAVPVNPLRCIWKELDFIIHAWFKLKEDFLWPNLSEVELIFIEGLQDLINSKLSWPLLECYAEKQALGEVSFEFLNTQVDPAVWEISGHITHMVLKRKEDYEKASEENAWRLLAEVSLSGETPRSDGATL
ncbi:unnamed protein product [Fraxinus pennsylvanica]|uniref:GDPGP1-like C-terminal domain-containing protein n=1 Tax=Fraxinus pennsylvanica TaxID=56036 RepID=A0AAD1ZZN6_9LAMI|nr:unnamed protein product [Fraxinus pennsylvanica]